MEFVTGDEGVQLVVLVEPEPLGGCPVEDLSASDDGADVEGVDAVEVGHHAFGYGPPLFDARGGVFELARELLAFIADGPQFGGQFGLGPVRVKSQFEVAVFVAFQLLEPLLELQPVGLVFEAAGEGGVCHQVQQLCLEVLWQTEAAVVPGDGGFDVGHLEVREITSLVLPASADEVEIQAASVTLAAHDDEASAATIAVQQATQVVVVTAFAGALARELGEQVLDAGERRGVNECFVAALVFDTGPGDEATVEAVTQQVFERFDGDRTGCVALVGPHGEIHGR